MPQEALLSEKPGFLYFAHSIQQLPDLHNTPALRFQETQAVEHGFEDRPVFIPTIKWSIGNEGIVQTIAHYPEQVDLMPDARGSTGVGIGVVAIGAALQESIKTMSSPTRLDIKTRRFVREHIIILSPPPPLPISPLPGPSPAASGPDRELSP
jgi:hypothetical protein